MQSGEVALGIHTWFQNSWLYRIWMACPWTQEDVHYVGGSEALPHPLSPSEEQVWLSRLAEDRSSARSILIERNLRLVVFIARKFENTGIHIEDLVSIGSIGLIKAVNTFDPTKKIKLATYASRCIENEILMHLRRTSKTRSEVSLDEPLNVDWDGNELLLSDIIGTENDTTTRNADEQVDRNCLQEALQSLNPREQVIMQLRFGLTSGKEKTQKEVADELGISQSYISRLEKKIIDRLRKQFDHMR
jgi:RNA polymerase sporulation-specific sigma factor